MDGHGRECSGEQAVGMENGFPWKSQVTPLTAPSGRAGQARSWSWNQTDICWNTGLFQDGYSREGG